MAHNEIVHNTVQLMCQHSARAVLVVSIRAYLVITVLGKLIFNQHETVLAVAVTLSMFVFIVKGRCFTPKHEWFPEIVPYLPLGQATRVLY